MTWLWIILALVAILVTMRLAMPAPYKPKHRLGDVHQWGEDRPPMFLPTPSRQSTSGQHRHPSG